MTLSLRQKLIFRVVLAVALILVMSGIVLNLFFTSDMHRRFDLRLLDRANLLIAEVETGSDGIGSDLQEFEPASSVDSAEADILQLTDSRGTLCYLSPMMKDAALPVPDLEAGTYAMTTTQLPDGRIIRCIHLGFHPEIGGLEEMAGQNTGGPDPKTTLTLTIGRDTGYLEHGLVRFRLILVAEVLVTLMVLMLALLALIRATLSPVEILASRIGDIDPAIPGEGLSSDGIPADFQPIVHRLNDLLTRLHDAFEREKTFSADFSHEIRTPLAGLRSTIEVGSSRPRTPEEYHAILKDCLEMSLGLQSLAETMLILKRMENGNPEVGNTTVQVSELVIEVMDSLSEQARARGITLDPELNPGLTVATDRSLLELAVRNILDNAISHGQPNSTVNIRSGESTAGPYMEVVNSGCPFSQEEAEELRARFRRGDPSRSSVGGHSGLGLALVDSIGKALGFKVTLHIEPGSIYRIRFTFGPYQDQVLSPPSTPTRPGPRSGV